MPDGHIPVLLPVPTEQDVQGFIELYRTKYGKDLDPVDAGRKLGGLMRFLYLTRMAPPSERGEPEEREAVPIDESRRNGQQSSPL